MHIRSESESLASSIESRGDVHEDDKETISVDNTSLIIEESIEPIEAKSKYFNCNTPEAILNAADALILILDNLSYSHHKRESRRSRPARIAIGIQKVSQRYSQYLVFVLMMFTAVVHANILSIVLPITMFLYALLEKPRPHSVRLLFHRANYD